MSKSRTKQLEDLKATAEKHLHEALRLTDEGLAKHPDDPVLPELRGQITEILTAIAAQWPLDADDVRVSELAWNTTHNIDDYFPKIGEEIGGACGALDEASNDDD